ncbi:HPr family phosphocarrier protein [Niallia sp. 01092]|uniref:HPr family phosphocarrier protein n=1 Tax=unclassified Niallia TaxID=2837522 RepID=UPI003FD345F7
MLKQKLIIRLPQGLHAIHTALFVREVFSFKSEVFLAKNGISANGKSIMKVMDLAVKEGDEITLLVDGVDEQIAMETLKKFLLNMHT